MAGPTTRQATLSYPSTCKGRGMRQTHSCRQCVPHVAAVATAIPGPRLSDVERSLSPCAAALAAATVNATPTATAAAAAALTLHLN